MNKKEKIISLFIDTIQNLRNNRNWNVNLMEYRLDPELVEMNIESLKKEILKLLKL